MNDLVSTVQGSHYIRSFRSVVFDRRRPGVLYAGRLCNGRNHRLYKGKKRRKYHNENLMDFCIGTVMFVF